MIHFRKYALAAALFLSFSSQAFADGHFGMSWNFSQFNDPSNKGRGTSQLIVGVPETDNRMALAACFVGSTAGLPRLELAANTRNMREGAPIDIEFLADAGPMLYRGEVKAAVHDEDYSGVRIYPGVNDPLWSVLKRMSRITYRVNGQMIELPLRGSSRGINAFLEDCRFFHGDFNPNTGGNTQPVRPSVPAATPPTRQPFDPRWASCDRLANVVSKNSDNPVTVTFRNQSDGFRTVMWIGFDGIPKEYAALNPGEDFTINTFLTHPWMFTDGPGNCLEMFMPQLGVSVFNITAPNRDFGPE